MPQKVVTAEELLQKKREKEAREKEGILELAPEENAEAVPFEVHSKTKTALLLAEQRIQALKQQVSSATPRNRRTHVLTKLEEFGLDPVEELIELYQAVDEQGESILTVKEKMDILKELNGYVTPKLRPIEIANKGKGNITINLKKFGQGAIELKQVK